MCALTNEIPHILTAHLLQGLARLEELARKLMDIVDNRVQANLDAVKEMLLVDLPADRCAQGLPMPVLQSCSTVKWTFESPACQHTHRLRHLHVSIVCGATCCTQVVLL